MLYAIIFIILAYLFIYSLCSASARSEREYEELLRRIEKEFPLP